MGYTGSQKIGKQGICTENRPYGATVEEKHRWAGGKLQPCPGSRKW